MHWLWNWPPSSAALSPSLRRFFLRCLWCCFIVGFNIELLWSDVFFILSSWQKSDRSTTETWALPVTEFPKSKFEFDFLVVDCLRPAALCEMSGVELHALELVERNVLLSSSCFETYLFYVAALFPLLLCSFCSLTALFSTRHSPLWIHFCILCSKDFFLLSFRAIYEAFLFLLPSQLPSPPPLVQGAGPIGFAQSGSTFHVDPMWSCHVAERRLRSPLLTSPLLQPCAVILLSLCRTSPPFPPPSLIFIYKALFSLLDLCSQVHPWLHYSPSSSSFHLQQRFHYIRSKHNSFIPSSPISSLFSLSYQILGFLKSPLHLHAFIYPLGCCCRQCAAPGSALLPLPGWASPWQFFALQAKKYWADSEVACTFHVSLTFHFFASMIHILVQVASVLQGLVHSKYLWLQFL